MVMKVQEERGLAGVHMKKGIPAQITDDEIRSAGQASTTSSF